MRFDFRDDVYEMGYGNEGTNLDLGLRKGREVKGRDTKERLGGIRCLTKLVVLCFSL